MAEATQQVTRNPGPVVNFLDDRVICSSCDGTGCGACGGHGEVACETELQSVDCTCGATYDAKQYLALPTGACTKCGTDLEGAVDDAWPESAGFDIDDDCGGAW